MSLRTVALLAVLATTLGLGATTATGQGGSSKPLFTTLKGRSEIGQNGTKGGGDPDGFGS
jgi:hypothetical protein